MRLLFLVMLALSLFSCGDNCTIECENLVGKTGEILSTPEGGGHTSSLRLDIKDQKCRNDTCFYQWGQSWKTRDDFFSVR